MFDGPRKGGVRGQAGDKGMKPDAGLAVVVLHRREGAEIGQATAELLFDLAVQGIFRTLIGLHLTARKLPLAGEVFVERALGDEHTALVLNQRATNGNGIRHGGR